jgi:hypothetical protein
MKLNRTRLKMSFAVRHARSVRLGIKDMISVGKLVEDWFALHNLTHEQQTTVTNQMARDWVRLNLQRVEPTRLNSALSRIYADAWVLSEDITTYEIARLVGIKKAVPTKKQLANSLSINWNTWTPGKRAANALKNPATGLKELLNSRNVTIQEINNTTMSRIGTILATALNEGKTPKQVSILIDRLINDPVRALMIAQTEMSAAIVQSSRAFYAESGVEQIEYLTQDPCDECLENEEASPIAVGEQFPNGDPPVHPNCMCDVMPYEVDNSVWGNQ